MILYFDSRVAAERCRNSRELRKLIHKEVICLWHVLPERMDTLAWMVTRFAMQRGGVVRVVVPPEGV